MCGVLVEHCGTGSEQAKVASLLMPDRLFELEEDGLVIVRWPCKHGHHYSHYDNTNVQPYTKCEDQHNVTLRRPDPILFDLGAGAKDRYNVWVVVE